MTTHQEYVAYRASAIKGKIIPMSYDDYVLLTEGVTQ
jgi:hypothetical protein